MSRKNQYEITIDMNALDYDYELLVEFDVTDKETGKTEIYQAPLKNGNPEDWDTEICSGKRINKTRVNGY